MASEPAAPSDEPPAGRSVPCWRPDEPASSSCPNGGTLQDSFRQFLEAKKKQRSRNNSASSGVRSAAEKQAMRREFIERARKYIGITYARKPHDPVNCTCEGCTESGRQLYHDPTFLDCCGLVRRIVREMQGQLGFRLGRWNQSYQYDTLPLRYNSVDQLQPGDLIFYSGTYVNPATKPHPFDMTHVEIFVGGESGKGTIGSRERFRWVKEYDSYEFVSKRWDLTGTYFCSIDPWLEGRCEAAHPSMWRAREEELAQAQAAAAAAGTGLTWDAKRFSIFSGPEDEEGDESAGDDS